MTTAKELIIELFNPESDNYRIACILNDGLWHNVIDIMATRDGGAFTMRNWAVRSRISNIKARIEPYGWTNESEIDLNGCAKYRIINKQTVLAI